MAVKTERERETAVAGMQTPVGYGVVTALLLLQWLSESTSPVTDWEGRGRGRSLPKSPSGFKSSEYTETPARIHYRSTAEKLHYRYTAQKQSVMWSETVSLRTRLV